jgi:flagellar biogenesis protein FliO
MEVSALGSAVLSFIFVIGLLLTTLWFIKSRGIGVVAKNSHDLHVLQTLRLGTKHNLSVVKYGDRTLLLGISGQQISLLDNQPTAQRITSENINDENDASLSEDKPETFTDHLKNLLAKN